jgi:transcriptional regulator with XRE-family HTH domain
MLGTHCAVLSKVSSTTPDVGRRITQFRRRLGLAQLAFARQTGISRNALILYERGSRVLKATTLAVISSADTLDEAATGPSSE